MQELRELWRELYLDQWWIWLFIVIICIAEFAASNGGLPPSPAELHFYERLYGSPFR